MCGQEKLKGRRVNATKFPSHPRVRQGDCILYPGELSFPQNTVSGSWGGLFSGSSRASAVGFQDTACSLPHVSSQEEDQMGEQGLPSSSLSPQGPGPLPSLEGHKCSCACLLQMPPLARPQAPGPNPPNLIQPKERWCRSRHVQPFLVPRSLSWVD